MADRGLELALRVSADTTQGRAAIAALNKSIASAGKGSGGALDPFTASVARATGGAQELTTRLGPLSAALAGVAAALSVKQLLAVAEEFKNYNARLALATKGTGNFVEMQSRLRDVAKETRAPLSDTVDLYNKLAPALAGMGRNGAQSAGIIATVSQAIGLSGASAAASSASLAQFTQAMGSGVLRGEELNSIMENTSGLADAIAEGLGVTRGELRKMGADGKLSSEAVLAGLEKVSARVASDFSQLPKTVGQSSTLVRNELVEMVGGIDRALGATNALASGLAFFAENIENVVRIGVPLLVAALAPLVVGLVATRAAAIKAALALAVVNPVGAAIGVAAAVASYVALDAVLEKVAGNKDRLSGAELIQQEKDSAAARLKVEEDLAAARNRLEKLRAVAAGRANASILLSTKEAVEAGAAIQRKAISDQISGYEALGNKLSSVWDDAISKARSLRAESASLLRDAAAARDAGADKAQDRRMRGWSDEERDSFSRRQACDLTEQAGRSSTFAQNAALNGNMERAAQFAAEAAKLAERAEKYADIIQDDSVAANLFEELGRIREDALKAESMIKEGEAKAQESLAQAVTQQIADNEARLKALRAELEKPATLQADITDAEAKLRTLQAQLDNIKDKTVTVTVSTVSGAPADTSGMSRADLIDAIPGRAYGGPLPGRARHDRSDNVLYRGTPGEWVIQRPAVRYWGASFIRAINEMRVPAFAYGGQIGAEQRSALVDAQGPQSQTPVVLQWPNGATSNLSASTDVAAEVLRIFQGAALQRGRRK